MEIFLQSLEQSERCGFPWGAHESRQARDVGLWNRLPHQRAQGGGWGVAGGGGRPRLVPSPLRVLRWERRLGGLRALLGWQERPFCRALGSQSPQHGHSCVTEFLFRCLLSCALHSAACNFCFFFPFFFNFHLVTPLFQSSTHFRTLPLASVGLPT